MCGNLLHGLAEREGVYYHMCDIRNQQSLLDAITRGKYYMVVHLACVGSSEFQRANCVMQMESVLAATGQSLFARQ